MRGVRAQVDLFVPRCHRKPVARALPFPLLRCLPRGAGLLARGMLVLGVLAPGVARGAPRPEPVVVAVLATGGEGPLARLAAGASLAEGLPGMEADAAAPLRIEAVDDGGSSAGMEAALKRLRALKPVGVIALPAPVLATAYAEAARTLRVPWVMLAPGALDVLAGSAHVVQLAPSMATQAVAVGDALRAPLGAASVAIVREAGAPGDAWEAALRRNLPATARDLGAFAWPVAGDAAVLEALAAAGPERVVVALQGRSLASFARSLHDRRQRLPCLYLDLARSEALRAAAPGAFEGSLLLGAPDPEGLGRMGEALSVALEAKRLPAGEVEVRAAEAARRLLGTARRAQGRQSRKMLEAWQPEVPEQGLLGPLGFEPAGHVRFFPLRLWRERQGRLEEVPAGLVPAAGCGPPLGFQAPRALPRPARGRVAWLTWGEGEKRTIEADLKALGLTTGGYDPELDQLVRDEIVARAMRIAYQLFRREPDGTPLPGWSWGVTFTTERPAGAIPAEAWVATLAGDDPEAGGRVTGAGTVSVFTTFLVRTMYAQHRLDPPLTAFDKPHLLGRHRWGEDKVHDHRGELLRCLVDGFASAIGLTLAHELGHLCGCGHDTEHPTSIMNVQAGAGAAWADCVWIPSHQAEVTRTLGVEGVEK